MLSVSVNLREQQTISMEQIKSLNILAMNGADLESFLKDYSLSNPVIDLDSERFKIEIEADASGWRRVSGGFSNGDTDEADVWASIGYRDHDLKSYLMMQLPDSRMTDDDKRHLRYMIEMLDERGWLAESNIDMCRDMRICEKYYMYLLSILQSLEPAGVGARDMRECLLLQLRRRPERNMLAEKLVCDHFEELIRDRTGKLAGKLRVSDAELEKAKKIISQLERSPSGELSKYEDSILIPDIVVDGYDGDFKVRVFCPGYFISDLYKSFLRESGDEEAKAYIKERYKEAAAVGTALSRRSNTIAEIGKYIVENQIEFFSLGPKALKRLKQSDLASGLAVNESTVSRAIKDKYLKCRWGVFPLKFFFQLSCCGSGATSNPMSAIRYMVDAEDKSSPLSDEDIKAGLMTEGFEISRRTVAKYRAKLGIASSAQRRRSCV